MFNILKYTKRISCFVNPFSLVKYEWSRKCVAKIIHKVNSRQYVNILLLDIKKYLQKLENGQMEIEASQWELHKDLKNVRFSIEEVRKLKEDVEQMKMTNAETMQMIRGLEKKVKSHEIKLTGKTSEVSEFTEEEENDYTEVSDEEKCNFEGCKRRKCCKILSEETIEITSDIKANDSEKEERDFSIEEFCNSEREKVERSEECRKKSLKPRNTQKTRKRSAHSRRRNRRNRKTDNAMMARYLKDSVKYNNSSSSKTSDKQLLDYDSFCTTTTRPEPRHGMYWDDTVEEDDNLRSRTGKILSMESIKNSTEQGSIMPGQFFCPKCSKTFSYKCEYIRHQIHEHPMSEKKFYCRTCRKFIGKQCSVNIRGPTRTTKNTKNSGVSPYKCSYCGKVTSSPEQLTAHIRKCRIISRTNLSENN